MIPRVVVNDKPPLGGDACELAGDGSKEALPQCVVDLGHRAGEGHGVVEVGLAQRLGWPALLSRGERASLGPAAADLAGAVVARSSDRRVEQRDAVPAAE